MQLEVLYHPRAAAAEYCRGYACTLYETCPHGCRYCYVPRWLHKKREDFRQPARPRKNILERLERDLQKIGPQADPVFLSFGCDPGPILASDSLGSEGITLIHQYGNRVRYLTKGNGFVRQLDPSDELGITLTGLGAREARVWEPEALIPRLRRIELEEAHDKGLVTFVSCEPIIDPAWTLEAIDWAAEWTDVFAIGCSNHLTSWDWPSPEEEERVRGIDWRGFLANARRELARLNCFAYFKNDLLRAAEGSRLPGEFDSLDAAIDACRGARKEVYG